MTVQLSDEKKFTLFKSLFRGRDDVYARFWTDPASNKAGYAPVYSLNSQTLDVTTLSRHFLGQELIGIYPLLPNNTTYFLAVDFDKANWLEQSCALIQQAKNYKLAVYLEKSKSGNGSHVWFFFDKNIPAWKARALGKFLLIKSGITTRTSFDRMFPSQDKHTGKGLGNLIALPLQGKYLSLGNAAFIDLEGNKILDQWELLSSITKISESQVDTILNQKSLSVPVKVTPMVEVEAETEPKVVTTQNPNTKLFISSKIFIPSEFLPDQLYKLLKSKLNFPNPEFYEMERRGYSTWQTPRFIKTIEAVENGILIPAGFLEEALKFCQENQISVTLENQQTLTKLVNFKTDLKLRPDQQLVAKEIFKKDRIILEAKPGFGKTIVALHWLSKRKQKVLIIVHTKALLLQWKKQVEQHFSNFKKLDIGIVGDNKWQIGEKITIASYQTLARRGVNLIKNTFGAVVVDECHHVPANTFTKVLKELNAKFVLGLTATAIRHDQLEKLMFFYLGPVYKTDSKVEMETNSANSTTVETKLIIRKTVFTITDVKDFQEILTRLINDGQRNDLLANQICEVLASGAKCLILTERIDHCEILMNLIRSKIKGVRGAIITGTITKKKREQISKRLHQDKFQLLIATGKLVGEGFDWPELTNLFFACPFSWKGKIIQYVGRVQRTYEGKTAAYIHDFVDYEVYPLRTMYFKRLRAYRNLGLIKEKTDVPLKQKGRVSENQIALF